jgi:hypothetical protein
MVAISEKDLISGTILPGAQFCFCFNSDKHGEVGHGSIELFHRLAPREHDDSRALLDRTNP